MTTENSKSVSYGLPHWGVFAVGLATTFRFEAIGFFFGSEVLLALFALAILAVRKNVSYLRPLLWALASFALLCVVIFVIDRMRHIALTETAKGVALYVALGLNLAGLYAICGRDLYRQTTFLIAMSLGTALQFALFGGFHMWAGVWKFAYGTPVTVVVCFAAGRLFGVSIRAACVLLGMAILNLLLDTRSVAGLCLFAAAATAGTPFIRRLFGRPSYKVLVAAGLVALALVSVFSATYKLVASSGFLDRRAEARYLVQNAAEGGFLLAARGDLIGAVLAIRKSPIIGFGSSPEDPQIARITVYMQTLVNPALKYHNPDSNRISTHSFLLGAWVQIGILGALFWAAWFMLAARSAADVLWLPDVLVAGWLIFILLGLWNILASPFAGFQRLQAAILINFVITLMASRARRRQHG